MNILPAAQALEHVCSCYCYEVSTIVLLTFFPQLDRTLWDKSALRDKTMLPLGLHEDDII
jgi:hypothetical protein